MASTCIIRSREYVRGQTTEWLTDAISPRGRACARGWHEWRPNCRQGPLTSRGALAIAVIRAELKRRPAAQPSGPDYVSIDTIEEYGITARLTRSIRVF